jgi:hypothetical protein
MIKENERRKIFPNQMDQAGGSRHVGTTLRERCPPPRGGDALSLCPASPRSDYQHTVAPIVEDNNGRRIWEISVDRRFTGAVKQCPRKKEIDLLKATHYMHSDPQPAERIVRFLL